MKSLQNISQFLLAVAIIIVINVIGSFYHGYIDLTEEKRYTLSKSTEKVIDKLDDAVYVTVLLDGKFPAGFKRLQLDGDEYVQKAIYPYALINYRGKFSAINLLQEQAPGTSDDATLNKSIELLEYKFVNIFQKLQDDVRKKTCYLSMGTIDTLQTKTDISFTPLLTSSPYSRYQMSPVRLNFEILKTSPDVTKFNKGRQLIGVLLEGTFPSLFENRVSAAFSNTLKQLEQEYRNVSVPTKQIVITDSDFMKNEVNYRDNSAEPIGFDIWERQIFPGNKDFILNSVEYMLDENGVLDSRAKEVKLRMLDVVKTKTEKRYWQFFNILLPLLLLLIFGVSYNAIRKKRYSRS